MDANDSREIRNGIHIIITLLREISPKKRRPYNNIRYFPDPNPQSIHKPNVKMETKIDRGLSDGLKASCMISSQTNMLLLTRADGPQTTLLAAAQPHEAPEQPAITIDVETYEGPTFKSRTAQMVVPWKPAAAAVEGANPQAASTSDTGPTVSISPNGQYCAVNSTIYELKWTYDDTQEWVLENQDIGSLPGPIAAMCDDTVWMYQMKPKPNGEGADLELDPYALPGLQNRPSHLLVPWRDEPGQTFPTGFTVPGTKPLEMELPQTCCNPKTGMLAVVHGGDMAIVHNLKTTTLRGGRPYAVKLSYTTRGYVKSVTGRCDPYCFMACSPNHIFVLDVLNNLHVHSWEGSYVRYGEELNSMSASSLGLRTGQRVLGIGYSDAFGEPILRLLLDDNKYIILKVEVPSVPGC